MIIRTLELIKQKYVSRLGLTSHRGQIAVEYVLLLVIGVFIAALITTLFVSRNPEDPGYLINMWSKLIQLIGSDAIER